MRFVVLIHSHPRPWGHPTIDHTPEGRAVPPEERAEGDRRFTALLEELGSSGELLHAEALADPATSTVYRWGDGGPVASGGPHAEAADHLAGFFVLDVATRERAEAVAVQFAGPGDVIELRPAMGEAGDDA